MSKNQKIKTMSRRIGKQYLPPDPGDACWRNGQEHFTREEVAHLLWTQLAMMSNDIKGACIDGIPSGIEAILDNPRIPEF